jgi:NAD+ synthetase
VVGHGHLLRVRRDDDHDTLDLLEVFLFADYEVVTAVNGFEGLNKAQETSPDLILTDIMMPVMSGIKLINNLRKNTRTGRVPVVAITSFADIKIRARMIHLYHEAERNSLVVAGTTNHTEYLLGDFCKYGDGGTDLEAIAHLYKNQIYQLAEYLGVTAEIINRSPSPDTFSLPVSDQEFFFRIPFDKLDHLLYGWEHGIGTLEVASVLGLSEDAVKRAYADFTAKSRATVHLRQMPGSIFFEM